MTIQKHWQTIKSIFIAGQKSNLHCAIASVDSKGIPNITPIGSVFLKECQTGFFFDSYTSALANNLEQNDNVCVMAVNTSKLYWIKSFFKGRFLSEPGVRLYGKAGPLRPATEEEQALIAQRIKPMKKLKGAKLIWSDFTHVRDLIFTEYRPIQYPKMMEHLWN
jgi:hypothetical protein